MDHRSRRGNKPSGESKSSSVMDVIGMVAVRHGLLNVFLMPGAGNEEESRHVIGEAMETSRLRGSMDSAPGSMIAGPGRSSRLFNFGHLIGGS